MMILIFRIGTTIPVPGVNTSYIKELVGNNSLLSLYNMFVGGAFSNFTLFALGIGPFITASIIIQLLSMDIIPYLAELNKQGGTGRNKLNQITRVFGIILAFLQGYIYSFAFIGNGTPMDYMMFSVV